MLIIDLVKMKLESQGLRPEFVINGNEALPKIVEVCPKAVILDLMLPDKSGEEILQEMKQMETVREIPVIVFTNKNRDENAERLLELGAAEYLVKASTDLNDLVRRIKELARLG